MRDETQRAIHQLLQEAQQDQPEASSHPADAGADSFDRDLILGLLSFEQERLYEIDAALAKFDEGTYGLCERTGRPIERERLEALPWARYGCEVQPETGTATRPHLGPYRPMSEVLRPEQSVAHEEPKEGG